MEPPTHDQRQRAFERLFGTVRADSGGTGMGSTDADRDQTLRRLSFDQLPDTINTQDLPITQTTTDPVAEAVPNSTQSVVLELDDKTKKFCALFGQVTPGQQAAYGGQSVQPDADVAFEKLPQQMTEELPEVKMVVHERDFLKEDMEERERTAREKPMRMPSKRYSDAHEKYVKLFG